MTDIEASMNKVEMTAEIVSAYVEHNSVPAGELSALIKSVHDSLGLLFGERKAEAQPEPLQPKVSIKKSITAEYIVCLEDGRRFKSLKRHLHAEHGLSPDEYRSKWGLAQRLPDGGPGLRRCAIQSGQDDRPRPQGSAAFGASHPCRATMLPPKPIAGRAKMPHRPRSQTDARQRPPERSKLCVRSSLSDFCECSISRAAAALVFELDAIEQ